VADVTRPHDVRGLTTGELERARRELRVSPALVRPDSPARAPIRAHLRAIDAELAERGTAPAGQLPGSLRRGLEQDAGGSGLGRGLGARAADAGQFPGHA